MWTYHPELLATPVPRYTSYPTAAEFHDGIGEAELGAALDAVAPESDISLYLHIPFCERICWYCGCNTGAANKVKRLGSYLDALRAEIRLVAERLAGKGRVTRIAFGGGSPNAISADAFLQLTRDVKSAFGADTPEISVELDPRILDREWLGAIRSAGVQRASLGAQTLAAQVQERIGRVQPEALIREAVTGLRKYGVVSLNFDLMYGLPGQSLIDIEQTLAATVEMRPDRIAFFGYAHVPHLIPRQRQIDDTNLPDAEARFLQAGAGYAFLTAAGYKPVGFDHFALPGDPLAVAARLGGLGRNFQGFTDDRSEILIGLGASAISSFPDRLIQNEKNAGRYHIMVSAGRLPAVKGVMRTSRDALPGRIIKDLLCRGSADIQGTDIGEATAQLVPFTSSGLVRFSGSHMALLPGALPYARAIAATFDPYRKVDPRRFSSAV